MKEFLKKKNNKIHCSLNFYLKKILRISTKFPSGGQVSNCKYSAKPVTWCCRTVNIPSLLPAGK